MKKIALFSLFLLTCLNGSIGQTAFDNRFSVQIQADVQVDPPQITLTWINDTTHSEYIIYRKAKDDNQWTDTLVVLDPSITTWTDTSVSVGIGYEYRVSKTQPKFPENEGPIPGFGYIYSGIQVPPTHFRGRCLLVVDSTFILSLQPEIQRLLEDLEQDGWAPSSVFVSRTSLPPKVKDQIRSWATLDSADNEAVFIVGHVPVPYSGDIAPDGHPEHLGAWPCDGYYAELDSSWTDSIITINLNNYRNGNKPGDGKFDNRTYPGRVRLQIGRVDFANMDKFPQSEEELLRRYLNKDHAWRMGQIPVIERGLLDNNFQKFPEGMGQVPLKTFPPMFGLDQVKDLPYRSTLLNESWLWSYGGGGGGPESASDISSTTMMVDDSLQTVFTMLFGSYFGDWDYPNDFLRAAIASKGPTLISTWGNRPNWVFHHMALGEHTGLAPKLMMNNYSLYWSGFARRFVHIGMMGDPTLRMHILAPIQNLNLTQDGKQIHLNWEDPASAIGYFIYKKTSPDKQFTLLNIDPVTDLYYIDPCVDEGWVTYMVRSVELRKSGSGTYYNLSSGLTDEILANPWNLHPIASMATSGQMDGMASVNPVDGCPPYVFIWSNGASTPSITNLGVGNYCVTVTDCFGCSADTCLVIDQSSSLKSLPGLVTFNLFPNPTGDDLNLEVQFDHRRIVRLQLRSMQGKLLSDQVLEGEKIQNHWDVRHLPAGAYLLQVDSGGNSTITTWVKY